ncbi:hypothetical protein HDU96_004786 [Phlyctochytrium bullatum]|nr:hypothetical protein HDU96_004786 [Phlyctochytrium bullatum]
MKAIVANGGLLDDDMTSRIITSEFGSDQDRHILLDGYPRTIPQAEYLDYHLRQSGKVEMAMYLDVPQDVILSRIEDRWIHPASGRTYNYSFNPPKRHGLDDETGEPLAKRPDDDVNVFRKRLEVFKELTEPLLDYYSRQRKLQEFRGSSSDELFPKLEGVLQHYLD